MAETLYIRLGSQAQDVIHWLVFSTAEQEIIASGELNHAEQLSQLTEKAQQRQVKVLVPNCDVLLKRLTVPGKSQRAIRQAAPYMLEDDLAQDVEQLFFSYAEITKDAHGHNCFTAIVARKQMSTWLSWLTLADIHVTAMLPEVLALPLKDNLWSAIALGRPNNEQVIVRQGLWQGFTLDPITWQLQCQAISQDNRDDLVTVEAYSPLKQAEHLDIAQMPEELPLALMAKHYQSTPFNLLQGEFKVKDKHRQALRDWLFVAGIASIAVLLSFAYKGLQLWQINKQLAQVELEIISTYKQAFPNTKRVRIATIRSQLNQKLGPLGRSSDSAGFLAMLSKMQPAFGQVPELKPNSVKYDGKRQELRIQAVANNYQHFEQFKVSLDSAGLTVKQGAQNSQGEQVVGSFSIVDNQARTSGNKSKVQAKHAKKLGGSRS